MDDAVPIEVAGRLIPHAVDHIRRYCGLPWSGGPPEVWGWAYYDDVPSDNTNMISPVDVACSLVLHPAATRPDLAFFKEQRSQLSAWLDALPTDVEIGQASQAVVEHVAALPSAFQDVSLSLLSKVLHRKRPHLVPPVDRHTVDWYRPVTSQRSVGDAWPHLVRAMHEEGADDRRRLLLAIALGPIQSLLWGDPDPSPVPLMSRLRAVDIAIWMESRGHRAPS